MPLAQPSPILTFQRLALRPMAGHQTLDLRMVVRIHQGQLHLAQRGTIWWDNFASKISPDFCPRQVWAARVQVNWLLRVRLHERGAAVLEPLLHDKNDLASVLVIAGSLLPAPALLLFVSKPALFAQLDPLRFILLTLAIGFAILLGAMFPVAGAAVSMRKRRQLLRQRDGLPEASEPEVEDWRLLPGTALLASSILLCLTAWAYWHPIRLGATLVLTEAILVAGGLAASLIVEHWPLDWTNPPAVLASQRRNSLSE